MSTKHSIALTAIAAALALPWGFAEAAVIGSFDPSFPIAPGAATNNLGYRGTVTFDLSAGCAGASGYIFNNTGGCTFTTLGATIDYYNATTYPPPYHPTPAQILVPTTLTQAQIGANFITGAYFDPVSGLVTAFDSMISPNIYVSVTDTAPAGTVNDIHYNDVTTGATPGVTSTYSDHLNLYFRSGYFCTSNCPGYGYGAGFETSAFVAQAGPSGGIGTVSPVAYMYNTPTNGPTLFSNSATITIQQTAAAVPEPESAALALIGLGALAATRRRKSAKAEPQAAESPPTD